MIGIPLSFEIEWAPCDVTQPRKKIIRNIMHRRYVIAHKRFEKSASLRKTLIYVRYRTDRVLFYMYSFDRAMRNNIPRFGHGYLVMAK
jgi:hypothetical protein